MAVNQDAAVRQDAGTAQHRLRLGVKSLVERNAVGRHRAFDRDLQRKLSLFRDALLATDQPVGLELDFNLVVRQAWFEVLRNGERHRQQDGAVKAVIGQVANRYLLGQRPGNITRSDACRQGPLHGDRQTGVARISPVGVPVRLVCELQTQPDRLAGVSAIGRMGQQLGSDLRRCDHGLAGILSGKHRRQGQRSQP